MYNAEKKECAKLSEKNDANVFVDLARLHFELVGPFDTVAEQFIHFVPFTFAFVLRIEVEAHFRFERRRRWGSLLVGTVDRLRLNDLHDRRRPRPIERLLRGCGHHRRYEIIFLEIGRAHV